MRKNLKLSRSEWWVELPLCEFLVDRQGNSISYSASIYHLTTVEHGSYDISKDRPKNVISSVLSDKNATVSTTFSVFFRKLPRFLRHFMNFYIITSYFSRQPTHICALIWTGLMHIIKQEDSWKWTFFMKMTNFFSCFSFRVKMSYEPW